MKTRLELLIRAPRGRNNRLSSGTALSEMILSSSRAPHRLRGHGSGIQYPRLRISTVSLRVTITQRLAAFPPTRRRRTSSMEYAPSVAERGLGVWHSEPAGRLLL